MTEFVSRWAVLQGHAVAGEVGDEAVERWVSAACEEYLARCSTLRARAERSGLRLAWRTGEPPPAAQLGRPTAVVVTASATEVRPASFTIAIRLRPGGGEAGRALNAACVVRLEDPASGAAAELGDEVRDELIAIEHAARHVG